jgi:phosphatidylglycerophosphate synthase
LKLYIPKILLYSRLAFCLVVVIFTFQGFENSKGIVLFLLYAGVVADIFDGIIARKLNISTAKFRLLDTVFDLLFYLSILSFIASIQFEQIKHHRTIILVILLLEALMYTISLIRFKKFPSPHAILSKFWGLYLVIEFSLVILDVKGNHFLIALIIGLFVHMDRVLIYVFLRTWDHDIPSSYHAFLLWQGKPITRHKLFNG